MKNIAIIFLCLVLFSSCTKQLYKYKGYDEMAFKYTVATDEKELKKAVKGYKSLVEGDKNKKKKSKKKNTLPPGVCVDYAQLLLLQGDTVKALTFFDKEVHLFPESKNFVESIKRKNGIK